MEYLIAKTVQDFYYSLKEHPNHRYMSWEHCFNAFQKGQNADVDYLSLQLAFYLASWGMYRGSSGLLWKDYKIHYETVNIIKGYSAIQCSSNNEIDESHIDLIIQAKDDIANYYNGVAYIKPTKEGEKKDFITATNTLITKILLGTLGCVPAYDRLLLVGFGEISELKIGKSFTKQSLKNLFIFLNNNLPAFKLAQERINKNGFHYPLMKIVDMYFWEVGRKAYPQLMDLD